MTGVAKHAYYSSLSVMDPWQRPMLFVLPGTIVAREHSGEDAGRSIAPG
jgi:hypothetical protein